MSTSRLPALLLAAATFAAPGPSRAKEAAPAPGPSPLELSTRLEQVSGRIGAAEEELRFVEAQYTERPEPSEDEVLLRRFSNGEIQYLLNDWDTTSVLFYDLVGDPKFRAHARYPDALFYLADSLYQQKNYIAARIYLRELLSLKDTRRYRDALTRYLEIAGRLNQFTGLDVHIQKARSLSGGQMPPELEYVYAKWLFKRTDLPDKERRERTRAVFQSLANTPGGRFQKQSAYFLGVLSVQEGDYAGAVERFRPLAASTSEEPELAGLEDLVNLSLGRLLYELGRHDEALDHYGRISRQSESFVESLYEIAWVHVKKGDFEQAKNAIDILLLVEPDGALAPDARLLQGNLQLKTQRYEEATSAYEGVISTYKPVRDQMDALLKVNQDPIAYFDNLLAHNERTLDVTMLLPPLALKSATTQKEVADAVRMVKDVDASRQGVEDSRTIALHILQALDERGLQVFPVLQEGYIRADAVDSALARAEQLLVQVESDVLQSRLTPEARTALESVRQEREVLRARFASIPASQEEIESRRERLQAHVDELDREAFRLGHELQSMTAISTAMRKWVQDTREERRTTPEDEKQFLEQLRAEEEKVAVLQDEVRKLRSLLADERTSANAFVSGEGVIRAKYRETLEREHALLMTAEGRLSGDDAALVQRTHEVRQRSEALRLRVEKARQVLRAQVERRGKVIRDKVLAEQQLLRGYDQEVASVSGDARNLVGRIAYESFQKVRQQFYELVLKADVGLVDVAFTRKQDKTTQMQKLSAQQGEELRALEKEFEGVLEDAK
ncbi:tetratricopeptide repeat protein [Archangium violaceum]|uniref:tetratricopeptide repeat protein n=1 Tax=Archangium violaceum TaxID=83451 RepID=UPI00195276C9|nr:tetratricopeptide repeat protein [Archangium violaceum]QRN94975.1 tetratricopeptide repeat protein [Archangium violaceum]